MSTKPGDGTSRVYLQITYKLGPEAGQHDHVGPFETEAQALRHRGKWGPTVSQVITTKEPPRLKMTPQEHIQHMELRRCNSL